MSNAKTRLTLTGLMVVSGLLAGCAWDNSPPPYHSVISYDPSRAQSYVSNVPTTNAPSTSDWKTNQEVGVGYGITGPNAPATPGQPVGGAVSTPSGMSYGTAAGTAVPAAPGTVIGSPPAAGISPSPSATQTSGPINTSAGVTAPQPGTGLNSFSYSPASSPQNPSLGTQPGIGTTNTGSSLLFTNRLTPLTNSFSPNGPTP